MNNKKLLCRIALVSCGYGIFSDSVIVPVLSQIYTEFPAAPQFLNNFIVTGGYLFSLIASFAASILLNYISKRKLLIGGTICFFVGGVGGFFCSSMEFLAVMRILDGISDGILAVTALSMITELYSEEKERAMMIGLYSAVSAICGVLLSFFSGIIAEAFEWKYVFFLNGISIVSVVLTIISIPETPVFKAQANKITGRRISSTAFRMISGYFISSALYCILFVFVDLYVQEKAIGGSILSGMISSLGSLVTFLTGIVFSILYMKMKKVSSFWCYVGLGISFFVLYKTNDKWIAVILFALASFFYSYLYSYYQMKISTIVSREEVTGHMSILNASYNFACFISAYIPSFVGYIFSLDQVYESFFPIAVLLLMIATTSGVLLLKEKGA